MNNKENLTNTPNNISEISHFYNLILFVFPSSPLRVPGWAMMRRSEMEFSVASTPAAIGLRMCGGLRRGRCKLHLNLSVESGKLGFQLLQFVLLLPHLARNLLQLRYLSLQHLVFRLVLVDGGGYFLQRVQEVSCRATGSTIARCPS